MFENLSIEMMKVLKLITVLEKTKATTTTKNPNVFTKDQWKNVCMKQISCLFSPPVPLGENQSHLSSLHLEGVELMDAVHGFWESFVYLVM